MVVVVLGLAGAIIIPFYRQEVGMSAYEYFGRRFGKPTRVYSSIAFTLAHFSKMGFIVYLLGLTINSMTGWRVDYIIVVVAAVTIFYTVIGGFEAVIWTDVIQGFVIWVGVIVALGYLLFLPAGGPAAVFGIAAANHKFSLGSMSHGLLEARDSRTGVVRLLLVRTALRRRPDRWCSATWWRKPIAMR